MEQNNISISEKQGKVLDSFPKNTMPIVVGTILIVLVTAVVGGILMYLQMDLDNKIEVLEQDIVAVEREILKLDDEGDLVSKSKRLARSVKTYNNYVDMDLDWMRFLEKAKDNTIEEVTYSAFSVDRKKVTFRIDGVAPSYRIVAEQLSVYMNDDEYKSAELILAVLRPEEEANRRVAFSIELTPTEEAFMSEQEMDEFDVIADSEVIDENIEEDMTTN